MSFNLGSSLTTLLNSLASNPAAITALQGFGQTLTTNTAAIKQVSGLLDQYVSAIKSYNSVTDPTQKAVFQAQASGAIALISGIDASKLPTGVIAEIQALNNPDIYSNSAVFALSVNQIKQQLANAVDTSGIGNVFANLGH